MPRLLIHSDAEADFDELAASQPKLAARMLAMLAEVAADPDLISMLTAHGFGADAREPFDVSRCHPRSLCVGHRQQDFQL